jgi:hypothetical protein
VTLLVTMTRAGRPLSPSTADHQLPSREIRPLTEFSPEVTADINDGLMEGDPHAQGEQRMHVALLRCAVW